VENFPEAAKSIKKTFEFLLYQKIAFWAILKSHKPRWVHGPCTLRGARLTGV